jgi:hypothetical protein
MLRLNNIRVRSFDISCYDIYWDLVSPFEDPNDYSFVVERSQAQFGPYVDATGEFTNKFHFRDLVAPLSRGFYTPVYYRIRVKRLLDNKVQVFPDTLAGVTLEAKPDLEALEMARQERLRLREIEGREVVVFPRKTFGVVCGCFDKVMKRKVRSMCSTCFDTGWVGGFNTPLRLFAQIVSPRQETTVRPKVAEIGVENGSGRFPNFPELFPGWIIVEGENIRWRVGDGIRKVRKSRSLVRQEAPLHRIPKTDIEYLLPINIANIEDFEPSPERNFTNPHNLETDSVIDELLGVFSNR